MRRLLGIAADVALWLLWAWLLWNIAFLIHDRPGWRL